MLTVILFAFGMNLCHCLSFMSSSSADELENGLSDSEFTKGLFGAIASVNQSLNEFTECGNGNIDLVLVLDGSGSIGADTFGQQIDFVS